MRNILMIAAIAGFATAATATPTTHHKRATDNGSAAVRELNEKSLQQASAGSTMTPSAPAPMSDSGAAAPQPAPAPGDAATPTDAAPMAPTPPTPPQ